MTIQTLIETQLFELLIVGDRTRVISNVFCCDLLSIAMNKAPADCVWVTVIGNINTLAVASLSNTSCVVLAEGAYLDTIALKKAKDIGLSIFRTEGAIFESALTLHQLLLS